MIGTTDSDALREWLIEGHRMVKIIHFHAIQRPRRRGERKRTDNYANREVFIVGGRGRDDARS